MSIYLFILHSCDR